MTRKILQIAAILAAFIALQACHPFRCAANEPFRVLAATFPAYIFTANVCTGIPGVKAELLIPAAAGCPHDFTLRPNDLLKLSKASVLIINGGDLEAFLEKPLANLKSPPPVIDASQGASLINSEAPAKHPDQHAGAIPNPHIFASPKLAIGMVRQITAGLVKADPQNAEAYEQNAKAYELKLADISLALETVGKKAANKKIALEHDGLAYLALNAGLEIAAIFENTGAMAQINTLIKLLNQENPALLAGDAQYPDKLIRLISSETGIPWAVLDSCASGPANPPLNYYEKIMTQNIKTLEAYFDK